MKITTRILVSAILSIGLVLMLGLLLSFSEAKVRVSLQAGDFVNHVVEEVFELSILTSEYVSSRSKSSEYRWESKHKTLGTIIGSTEFDDPSRAEIWARVAKNHRSAKDIFAQIKETADREELQARLLDQLTFKSQTIVSNAFALKHVIERDLDKTQKQAELLSGTIIVLLILVSIFSTVATIRTVVIPVTKLHKGVEIIAKGNLDHRMEVKSRDEIGELGAAFNRMTENLKTVTASRDELDIEITQRKEAEEALQQRTYDLGERVKEINCLYGVSELAVEPDKPLDEILQGALDLIQTSWQYPDITCTRIVFQGHEFRTENFAETEWKQSSDIIVSRESAGAVEVYYLEEKPEADEGPFLKEERGLIDAFGRQLGAIAERKMAEEKLKKYSDKLEEMVEELRDAQENLLRSERLATLGQFSGSISHELRNPLGVIDSSAYYLKTKLKDADEKVQEHLDRIKSSVVSATTVIQSLLNLTRMKEPHLTRLELTPITSQAIATSKVPVTVKVIQDFSDQEILVNGDGEQLRMAFKNIVNNAVDAMDDKGTLTVRVGMTADGKGEVSFVDTGPGIASENLDKIFQPLFSTKAKGIGFGLSIAKMIVDKQGGTIEAESELGKGATIITQLPLYADKTQ